MHFIYLYRWQNYFGCSVNNVPNQTYNEICRKGANFDFIGILKCLLYRCFLLYSNSKCIVEQSFLKLVLSTLEVVLFKAKCNKISLHDYFTHFVNIIWFSSNHFQQRSNLTGVHLQTQFYTHFWKTANSNKIWSNISIYNQINT